MQGWEFNNIRHIISQAPSLKYECTLHHKCYHILHAFLLNSQIPGDGVITGHGQVNGRLVFVFSQVSGIHSWEQ